MIDRILFYNLSEIANNRMLLPLSYLPFVLSFVTCNACEYPNVCTHFPILHE